MVFCHSGVLGLHVGHYDGRFLKFFDRLLHVIRGHRIFPGRFSSSIVLDSQNIKTSVTISPTSLPLPVL